MIRILNEMPLFGSKECTKESTSEKYISTDLPCTKILTTQKGSCCKQKDLPFLLHVASIYDSRTSESDDEQLQGVSDYVKEFESYHEGVSDDTENTHIDMSTKKGKYLFDLVGKYHSTFPLVVYQEKKFKPVPMSTPRVVYISNNVSKMSVPMHKYVTIVGRGSTVEFSKIELFVHDRKSREFEQLLKTIEGNSYLKISIPLVFSEPMTDFFLLQEVTSALLEIGRNLAKNGSSDTILHFEFQTETLHRRLIQVTLDSLGFENTPVGVIMEETVPGYTLSVEIREIQGKNVAAILRTIGDETSLEEKEMTSEILDLTAVDFISFEEISVRDYLEQDAKNMVLLSNGKAHFTNVDDLKTSMEEGIVYECKEANERLFQDPSNVLSDVELFNARRIGTLPGYIIAEHLTDSIRLSSGGESSRIFSLHEHTREIPAVISKRVYEGEDDLVSANHCQVGAEGHVYSVFIVKIN